MRHRRISPFGLWGSLMWRSKQKRSGSNSEEHDKGEMRLARETVGNGTENPSIIATETLIRKEPTQDFEDQIQRSAGYGGEWMGKEFIHNMEC